MKDQNITGTVGVWGKFIFGGGAAGVAFDVGRTYSDPAAVDVKASAVVVIAAVSTIGDARAWANWESSMLCDLRSRCICD